jgi:transcriptional regulator with XRE-family HTH domain
MSAANRPKASAAARPEDSYQPPPAPPAVGERLLQLRELRNWSLDALSQRAGVSKSMLSQIERGQANPTVAVVWRLANALGVPLLELLEPGKEAGAAPKVELVSSGQTPTLRTADELGELKILGPIESAGHCEWYQLQLSVGGTLVSQPHDSGTKEHLTVLSGSFEVVAGSASSKVSAGETARYPADVNHSIRNIGRSAGSALLVVMHPD